MYALLSFQLPLLVDDDSSISEEGEFYREGLDYNVNIVNWILDCCEWIVAQHGRIVHLNRNSMSRLDSVLYESECII